MMRWHVSAVAGRRPATALIDLSHARLDCAMCHRRDRNGWHICAAPGDDRAPMLVVLGPVVGNRRPWRSHHHVGHLSGALPMKTASRRQEQDESKSMLGLAPSFFPIPAPLGGKLSPESRRSLSTARGNFCGKRRKRQPRRGFRVLPGRGRLRRAGERIRQLSAIGPWRQFRRRARAGKALRRAGRARKGSR